MTKEQLLKQDTITQEQLYSYLAVKNYNDLRSYLLNLTAKSMDDLKISDVELFNGFELIYSKLESVNYNPIQETIMLSSVIAKAIYGLEIDDFELITKGLGVFKTAYLFNEVFADIEIVSYYKTMYAEYVTKNMSMSILVTKGMDQLMKFIDEKLQNFNMSDLEQHSEKIQSFINEIKTKLQ